MEAGRLDRRITLQSPTTVQDSFGEPIITWTTEADVWAKRLDLRASERFVHQQTTATVETVFTIRYRAGVSPAWRVVDEQDRIYDVLGLREPDRRRSLELLCKTQVGQVE